MAGDSYKILVISKNSAYINVLSIDCVYNFMNTILCACTYTDTVYLDHTSVYVHIYVYTYTFVHTYTRIPYHTHHTYTHVYLHSTDTWIHASIGDINISMHI